MMPSRTRRKSLPKLPVQRTEFGIDVGGANSVGGLRALWRGLLKSRSNAALTSLRPIIVIKEGSNGLGMQLRLVAGPLDDAAAAAKICAGLTENNRPCATTVFDGQRLVMNADEAADADKPVATKPATTRYFVHHRGLPKRVAVEEPAKKPDPPSSTLSSFFHRQNSHKTFQFQRLGIDFSSFLASSGHGPPCPVGHSRSYSRNEKNSVPALALQVQWLLVVGFLTVGYALYLRYLAIEFSTVALACDAGLQTMLCKTRDSRNFLFRNQVFGIVALIIAALHVIRPSIVLLTGGLIAAGLGSCFTMSGCRALRSACLFWALHGPRLPQRNREQQIDRAGPQRLPVVRPFVEDRVERRHGEKPGKHRFRDRADALLGPIEQRQQPRTAPPPWSATANGKSL